MASKGMVEDLAVEILARLPVKSLMRFKNLSKSYYALITSHRLISKNFQFSAKNPRLLIFHYQSNLSSKPCISLLSNELSQTQFDLAETSRASLDLLLPFTEESQPPIDSGLRLLDMSQPLIDLPITDPEISQPTDDIGFTFPESSQPSFDDLLPFPNVSEPSVNFELPIPKLTLPPVDLELPFPDKDVFEIVPYGPCNGIFCLYGSYLDSPGQLILWNPATKEVKVLPLPHHPPSHMELCTHGFGIDPKTNDYKVVSILTIEELQMSSGETQIPLVEVYQLSTNSWRKIKDTIPAFNFSYSIFNTYLNGVYHWLAKSSQAIVCFDMSNEVFLKMKLPLVTEDNTNEFLMNCNIAVLNGCIAYVKEYCSRHLLGRRIEIWVMNKYGVEESWTKRFSIGPQLGLGKFRGFWKDIEILATGDDNGTLFSYNLDTQQPVLEFPVHCGIMLFPAFRYVESIFPISVLAEEKLEPLDHPL